MSKLYYCRQTTEKCKSIRYPSKTHPYKYGTSGCIYTSGCGVCASLMVLHNFGFTGLDTAAWTQKCLLMGARSADGTNMDKVAAFIEWHFSIVSKRAKTVADLKGKNVSIGAAGSGVYFNAIDVLGAYGLTENDIKPTYQSFGDSADALKNGQIDAAFIVAGAPTTAVTDLATTKDTYLVSLDSEHIAKLLETSDYYTETVIAKDVYFGD